jgi:hypothetical protein
MTDMQRVQIDLAAVLTTALDIGGAVPKGPLYLALGCDIDRWSVVEALLVKIQLAQVTSETLTLTQKGQELAKRLESVLQK